MHKRLIKFIEKNKILTKHQYGFRESRSELAIIELTDKGEYTLEYTTFLGITIDECLTWSEHITQVAKKITRASGIIAKIRYFLYRNALKLVYYALVYPYLTWGNTYKKHESKNY